MADASPVVGQVDNALADTGYFSEAAGLALESTDSGTTAFVAMKRERHGSSVAQLEARADPPPPPKGALVAERMEWRLHTEADRKLYGLRKQTVKPVLGIIKEALGFRRFLLRRLAKANQEGRRNSPK